MTSYSNVRFGFSGTLGQSYINFFLFPFLFFVSIYAIPIGIAFGIPELNHPSVPQWIIFAIITIIIIALLVFSALLYALIKKKNSSYLINGTRYGQGIFSTQLETIKFLKILLKTIAFSVLIMGTVAFLIGLIVNATVGMDALMELKDAAEDPVLMQEKMGAIGPVIGLAYLGLILGSMLVIAYSMTRQRTYVYENSTLDDKITFASTLKARPLAWMMISNLLLVLFTLGLAFPWAKVRMARLMLENTLVDTEHGFNDYVTQKQEEESSLGEQIGDAFDVDVGIGL